MVTIMDSKGTGAACALPINSFSITRVSLEAEAICRHTYETILENVITVDNYVTPADMPCVWMVPTFPIN
jgi:hypothetical protein